MSCNLIDALVQIRPGLPILKVMKCVKCNTENEYSWEYDSYFCPKCNVWTESKCKDKDCKFCLDRPETPMKNAKSG